MSASESKVVPGPPPERRDTAAICEAVKQLPDDWHGAGTLAPVVLDALARHATGRPIRHSLETGSGKSTLLFSHLSESHLCFAVDAASSITRVRESPLFQADHVTFIEGPTQKTLPAYGSIPPLQFALIDGPHAFPFPALEYYYIYPHLETDAILAVDDINIPTNYQMFELIGEDDMFELLDVVSNTAFFRRTDAPTFERYGDGWWLQAFNKVDGAQYRELAARRDDSLPRSRWSLWIDLMPRRWQDRLKEELKRILLSGNRRM